MRQAFKNNLGGKVVAQFTVDQAGSVGDIKILQSPDKCFSDEVTRILESRRNGHRAATKKVTP
ncbi:MAG: energy transducer TonB [Alistipes putredinis]